MIEYIRLDYNRSKLKGKGRMYLKYEGDDLKFLVAQLNDLKAEIEEKEIKIQELQCELEKINKSNYLEADVVSYGKKGKKSLGTARITGFPYPYYQQKKVLLEKRICNLANRQQKLLELITVIEEKIEGVSDSKVRRILSLRYVEGLKLKEIEERTGYSKGRISQLIDKFLKD